MTSIRSPERVLIDTHTLIWAAEGPSFPGYRLTSTATRAMVEATEAFVSQVSFWELAIKSALPGPRALRLSQSYADWFDAIRSNGGLTMLSITDEHLKRVATLPPHHGDPFDRLLVAQSLVEEIPIVSADVALDAYGVRRIW